MDKQIDHDKYHDESKTRTHKWNKLPDKTDKTLRPQPTKMNSHFITLRCECIRCRRTSFLHIIDILRDKFKYLVLIYFILLFEFYLSYIHPICIHPICIDIIRIPLFLLQVTMSGLNLISFLRS